MAHENVTITINGAPYDTFFDEHGVQRIVPPGNKAPSDINLNDVRRDLAYGKITENEAIALQAEFSPSVHLIWETYCWEANVDYHKPVFIDNPYVKQA